MRLRGKITISISSVILVIMVILGYISISIQNGEILRDFENKLDYNITQTSESVVAPLFNFDQDTAIHLFQIGLNDRETAAIFFIDPQENLYGWMLDESGEMVELSDYGEYEIMRS